MKKTAFITTLLTFITTLVICLPGAAGWAADEPVHLNKVVAKLVKGEVAIGTWMSSMSPFTAIGLAQSNGDHDAASSIDTPMIDFVLIDMEHQPFDVETLTAIFLAFNSKHDVMMKGNLQPNICPFVRIPCDAGGPVEPYIKQALDAGAYGVVIPHCRNAEEAEKVVRACRYPQALDDPTPKPLGNRGASPWPCSYVWGLSMPEYVKHADLWPLDPDGDIMAVIMIEDSVGKNNVDEILQVPGIGAIIFGPYDYSFNCGHPGDVNAAPVLQAKKEVADACKRHNVPFVAFANPDNTEALVKDGFRILLSDSDIRPSAVVTGVIEKVKSLK